MLILLICVVLGMVSSKSVNDNDSVNILQYESQPLDSENRYKFYYELSDGQKRMEEGELVPTSDDQNKISLFVTGSYEFVAPDGKLYRVQYTADEKGFHPILTQGEDIGFYGAAVAPPAGFIPPSALTSLVG